MNKHLPLLLSLVFSLNGCVGITTSKSSDIEHYYANENKKNYGPSLEKPNRAPDIVNPDGSETFITKNESRWCGATIWAVIPVPLKLPTCKIHNELTFKDGKLSHSSWQEGVFEKTTWCSPIMPIVNLFGPNTPVWFCETTSNLVR